MNTSLRLLDISPQFPNAKGAYHLAYYHPTENSNQDEISRYFLDFRKGQEPQTTQWIRLAALMVSQTLSVDVVIRALSSKENSTSGSAPLDRLCLAIARKCNARYCPESLKKNKSVDPLDEPGERRDRKKDLRDAYTFSSYGLGAARRILVVDDIVTTGNTFSAIAEAVKAVLPDAEVLIFALAKTDDQLPNTHLEPGYFKTAASPVDPRQEKKTAANQPLKAPVPSTEGKMVKEKPGAERVAHVNAHPHNGRENGTHHRQAGSSRKGVGGPVLVLGVVGVLLFSAFMLLSKKQPPVTASAVPTFQVPEVEANVQPSQTSSITVPLTVPKKTAYPKGVVTAPSVGLRSDHSVESKPVRSNVRKGERVEILGRVSTGAGPSWLQIRTSSGKTGWLWASLIREL